MNTVKSSKSSFAFLITSLITAFIAIVLRTVSFIFFFDEDIGYFMSGAVLPIIFNILLFAAAVFFTVFSLLKLRGEPVAYCAPTSSDKAIFILCAILTVALAISDLLSAINGDAMGLLFMLLSAMSALFFIFDLLKFKNVSKIELSILIFIRVTFMLAMSYFDQTVQMNSPDKVLFGLACIFAMLFIVNEMKILVNNTRPAIYYLSSALAILFCASSSVPSIVACCIGKLPMDGLFFEYIILLAIAIYCVDRLLNVIRAAALPKECGVVENEESELTVGTSVDSVEEDVEATETTDTEAVGGTEETVATDAKAEESESDTPSESENTEENKDI